MIGHDRKSLPVPPRHDTPARSEQAGRARGEPLPAPLSSEMSARFGVSFGDVRVRRDAGAAQEAKARGAEAFARGDEIAFAPGRYDPASGTGRKLIAHELAHVVQQRRGGALAGAERRADRAAEVALAGRAVDRQALGGAPVGVHAQPQKDPPPDTAGQTEARSEQKDEYSDEGGGGHNFVFSKTLDQFALDKDTLTKAHMGAIDELAFSISLQIGLLARGKALVEITGHTDTSGTEEHNTTLGQDRADRVRETLAKKLTGEKGGPAVDWTVRSAGESQPLVPTGNDKHEPRNRRVEVRVTIVSLPEPKKEPVIDLFHPKITVTDEPPPGPRRKQSDVDKQMDDYRRRVAEFDKNHPKKPKNFQEQVVDGLMNVLDPLIDKLPVSKSLRDKAREGVRDGIKSGMEKTCEAAIDATGASGSEADALKSACKAAIKVKPGEQGGGQ